MTCGRGSLGSGGRRFGSRNASEVWHLPMRGVPTTTHPFVPEKVHVLHVASIRRLASVGDVSFAGSQRPLLHTSCLRPTRLSIFLERNRRIVGPTSPCERDHHVGVCRATIWATEGTPSTPSHVVDHCPGSPPPSPISPGNVRAVARSTTSIVLRRTSRTRLPILSLGPTFHGTGGSTTCAGGGRKTSHHVPDLDILQSHAQCCPETAFQEEWNVFITCAQHSNKGTTRMRQVPSTQHSSRVDAE